MNFADERPTWGARAALWILAALFFLPLLGLIFSAFKTPAQIYTSPPYVPPAPPTLQNLLQAAQLIRLPRLLANTLWVAAWTVLGSTFSTSLTGYAFAVIPARGKPFWFGLLLLAMAIPPSALLLPTFVLFSRLGWVNTYLPLIVPPFFAPPFYTFLFRQYFLSIPRALFESAELDGCNPLTAYWYIALPLARPVFAAVSFFAFIGAWNDYLNPLIYLNSPEKFTLSLGLAMFQGVYITQLHYILPLTLVTLLPVALVFLLAQRAIPE